MGDIMYGQECELLCTAVWASSFRTNTRPVSFVFFREKKYTNFVTVWKRYADTSVYGDSYGTGMSFWGQDRYSVDGILSCKLNRYDSCGLRPRRIESKAPVFYIEPAHGCVQCGWLWSDREDGPSNNFIDLVSGFVHDSCGPESDMITLGQYTILLSWLRAHDQKHAIKLHRCKSCKQEYKNNLWGHLYKVLKNPIGDDYEKKKAEKFLRSLGKYLRTGDKTPKQYAISSIRRRLRKKMGRLSQSELVFFQMFAGANAIKTQGGLHGDRSRAQRRR